MRRNVLNWLGQQFNDASHAVVLTHNIDFLFVQGVLIPKLRSAGNPRITIFADAMCATATYSQQQALLDGLGVRYRVVPVDLGPMRRFHAKAILLSNPERAVCAIGSGNLTHGGMSSNHEIWAFGASDDAGANLVAGLRDYVRALVERLPLVDPVRDDINAIFDPEQTWHAGLPPSSGLAMSPADRSILDQIGDYLSGEIASISILAPYFDDHGAALAEIFTRFKTPVTVWVQPRREGLSATAAASLPEGIMLKTIECREDRRPSFIHAKLFAFHGSNDVVLAIGSANCSRAALLATSQWGNAELMAVDRVTTEDLNEVFAELVQSDDYPNLPDHPVSEEWELEVPGLRVLAARHEGDRLSVAFKSSQELKSLSAETDEGVWSANGIDLDEGLAFFTMPLKARSIVLSATTSSGERLRSPKAWVDDEASLSAPASLKRVFQRLQSSDQSEDPAASYRSVLNQFKDYIRDPEAARRRMPQSKAPLPTSSYDPAAVFSENFGRAAGAGPSPIDGSRKSQSVLALIEALFKSPAAEKPDIDPSPDPSLVDPHPGEEPDPDDEEKKLFSPRKQLREPKVAAQLERALRAIESALVDPSFVNSRRAELLGVDIALTALLLVKGLSDGHIGIQAYRSITRELWSALFFGSTGRETGSIAQREKALSPEARAEFIASFASAKLSAAMVLWPLPEWHADDPEARWFRMSAALLHQELPQLFASAPADDIAAELEHMAEAFLPPGNAASAQNAWVSLVRAGEALRLLFEALSAIPLSELVRHVKDVEVQANELLWQANTLAFPLRTYRREQGVHAEVRALGEDRIRKFKGDHLVPVRTILDSGLLDLPHLANESIGRFIQDATVAHAPKPKN